MKTGGYWWVPSVPSVVDTRLLNVILMIYMNEWMVQAVFNIFQDTFYDNLERNKCEWRVFKTLWTDVRKSSHLKKLPGCGNTFSRNLPMGHESNNNQWSPFYSVHRFHRFLGFLTCPGRVFKITICLHVWTPSFVLSVLHLSMWEVLRFLSANPTLGHY